MFEQRIELFGNWERRIFENKESNCRFSIIPAFGATVLDLVFDGKNILDHYQTPEELEVGDWCKNAILFPFPNRLKNGRYELADKVYQFPINDASTQNALHGFGYQKPFSIKNIELSANEAKIICTYEDSGDHPAYPFPFICEVSFSIKNNEFEVGLFFENKSQQRVPVGLGWHPYFMMSDKVNDCFLQMPACRLVEVDETMIPTGIKYDYHFFNKKRKIDRVVLDNGFEIKKDNGRAEVLVEGEYGTIKYWQATGNRLWNFVQIFTPPNRKSIAIEPMTCNIDAFNNRDGLVLLERGEQIGGRFGVKFEKLSDT